jgi:vesicle-associated membrane protein 7
VDDVKNVMTQNIERVLDRGERLENLIDKTEELEASVSGWDSMMVQITVVVVCIM